MILTYEKGRNLNQYHASTCVDHILNLFLLLLLVLLVNNSSFRY